MSFVLTCLVCTFQVMVPENFTEFINDLTSLVKNNVIPMSRIDDAVQRILKVKFVMGLFENPMADFSLANQLGSEVNIMDYCENTIRSNSFQSS